MKDQNKRILVMLLGAISMLIFCIVFSLFGWGDDDSAMERIVGIIAIISGMGSVLVGISSISTTSLDNVREYFSTGEDEKVAKARHVLYNYRNLKIKYGKTVKDEDFDEWISENLNENDDKDFYVKDKKAVYDASSKVLNFYQMWGLLQSRNFLPIWVFDTTSGYNMIRIYEATIDIIEEKRESNRLYAGHVQDLCVRVNDKYSEVIDACRADNRKQFIEKYDVPNPDASPYFNILINPVEMPKKGRRIKTILKNRISRKKKAGKNR